MSDAVAVAPEKRKLWIVELLEFLALTTTAAMMRLLPRSACRRAGASLGALSGRVIRRRSRLALENLETAFPDLGDRERETLLRDCWRHFGAEITDFVRHLDRPGSELADRVDVVGQERFDRAVAVGRGVMAFSAHLGSWEAAVAALPRLDPSFLVVARPLDNRLLERRLRRARGRGVETVHRRVAARAMVAALRASRPVIVLPDQAVQPREGELLPFVGREAWTTTAPARLAIHFGSPLVPMFCLPDGGRFRLEIGEPRFAGAEDDAVSLTCWINDVISEAIRAHPSQWLWMHDRWKRT